MPLIMFHDACEHVARTARERGSAQRSMSSGSSISCRRALRTCEGPPVRGKVLPKVDRVGRKSRPQRQEGGGRPKFGRHRPHKARIWAKAGDTGALCRSAVGLSRAGAGPDLVPRLRRGNLCRWHRLCSKTEPSEADSGHRHKFVLGAAALSDVVCPGLSTSIPGSSKRVGHHRYPQVRLGFRSAVALRVIVDGPDIAAEAGVEGGGCMGPGLHSHAIVSLAQVGRRQSMSGWRVGMG